VVGTGTPSSPVDAWGMQCQVEAIPSLQVNAVTPAVDVFEDHPGLLSCLVEDDPDLLQLTHHVGVPVTGNRLMYQHPSSFRTFIQEVHRCFSPARTRLERLSRIWIHRN
jgi:hypothetical protein